MAFQEEEVNVLLVDDKPDNLVALRAILDDLGYNLVEAQSGDEALKRLLGTDFAVILLDVQMPGLNGFETARLIRERKRSEHTPIVFLSAYDDPEFPPARAYTLGAVDFLQKPIEPIILRSKVKSLVAVAQVADRAQRQAEQLRLLVEGSRDFAIFMLDPGGRVITWNPAAERVKGFRADEVIGKHFSVFYTPEDRAAAMPERGLEIARTQGRYEEEGWRIRNDGSRFWAGVVITALRDDVGRLIGYSKVTRDMTEKRQAEESAHRLQQEQSAREAAEARAVEARQNAEVLRFLAEASKALNELLDVPSMVNRVAELAVPYFADLCTVDLLEPTGTLQRIAVAHVERAKIDKVSAYGERFPPPADAPLGPWRIIRSGEPELVTDVGEAPAMISADLRLMLPGEPGPQSYLGVPIAIRGKVIGVMTFVLALSRRRFEERDLNVARDLASRVGVAIENARLYAEAREADRRKDEFLAMLGHELRNPLAPIANALHLMKRADSDPSVLGRARDIAERQFRHLTRLVDDLLDVSRMMRGKIGLRKERVALDTVVASAVEMSRPVIEARQQQLTVKLPPEPVLLHADPTRLSQVVANLLHNAAKYSEKPGRIFLSALRHDDHVVLRVKDEGIGIHPELLPSIFDLFVQGDRSLERREGGLGIGLTVVRKLVEMHGGTITVESAGQGQGSEFTVTLPALPASARPSAEVPDKPAALDGPPRRVLVVDDNVDAASSMAMLLRDSGHEVFLAHDGADALHVADKHDPDIVILDIGLPEMSGYEVARELRKQPKFRDLVLVALTGYGQDEDRRRSREAGFDHHLVKPVKSEALQRIIAGAPSARTAG